MLTIRRFPGTLAALLAAGSMLLTTARPAWAAPAAAEAEAKQIAVLEAAGSSFADKATACRALVRTGTAAAVPALAHLLDDEKLSHLARYALEPIPDPAVDVALRAALDRLAGRRLVGVIGSIGARRDAGAAEALAKLLQHADAEVVQAAARALGRLGTSAGAEALRGALPAVAAENRPAVVEGLFCNAEALQASGGERGRAQALALYDSLRLLPQAPHQFRAAALRGAVLVRQDAGVPLLLEALRGEDAGLAAAAARTAMELPGAAVTAALAAELGKLPADRQILVASVLGRRGDAAALPALVALARSGAAPARVAAIRTLAELGDAASALLLVDLQKDPDPEVARAAKEALAALAGPEVDAALMALLAGPDAAARASAIDLLGQRRVVAAIPALLKAAADADEAVRTRAIKVLGDLGGAAQFQALIGLLLRAPSPASLQAAEEALAAICVREARPAPGRVAIKQAVYGKLPDGPSSDVTAKVAALVAAGTFAIEATNGNFGDPAAGVVKMLRLEYAVDGTTEVKTVRENETVTITAGAAPAALAEGLCAAIPDAAPAPRRALLRVLRSARGPAALAAVRGAMADADAETRAEAIAVLCAWPTPAALDEITRLAEAPPDARAKILALRGCFRLIPLLDAPVEAKLAVLKRTLAVADRKEERMLALTALAAVPAPETLALAATFLDNPELKEEAAVAVLTLAAKIAPQQAAEATAAVKRVQQAGVSEATAKRAEALLAEIGKKPGQ
jgi:HEAT repeat protein